MEKHYRDPYPTRHLVEKLNARAIRWSEVVEIIENPEVTFGPDIQGRRVMQKGDLSVVVARDGGVITVLLREADQWTDEDVRRRSLDY